MNHWVINRTVDLAKGAEQPQSAMDLMVPGDGRAHTIRINVLNHGSPADLSGASAIGYFQRADGGDPVAVAGSVNGNTVSVTLTSPCYSIPGRMRAIVRLVSSDSHVSILQEYYNVIPWSGRSIIMPESPIQDMETLLTYIEQLEGLRGRLRGYEERMDYIADGVASQSKRYVSTGAIADYETGIQSTNTIVILNDNGVPLRLPKGGRIKKFSVLSSDTNHYVNVYFLRKTASDTFTVLGKYSSLEINADHMELDALYGISFDEDVYIGIGAATLYSLRYTQAKPAGGATGGYYFIYSGDANIGSSFTPTLIKDTIMYWGCDLTIEEYGNRTIVVDIQGTGEYMSIVDAVNSITNASALSPVDIHIKNGVYNIIQELGGSAFLSTITDSSSSKSGLLLPDHVNLIGDGDGVVLDGNLADDVATLTLSTKISTLNLNKNNNLKNIAVHATNLRYAVHDESSGEFPGRVRIVENCKFYHWGNKADLWRAVVSYGCGFDYGERFEFTNCEFYSRTDIPVLFHDRVSNARKSASILLKNCLMFSGSIWGDGIKFGSVGINNNHNVVMIGCNLSGRILCNEESKGSGVGTSFDISGFGNSVVPHTVENTGGNATNYPHFSDETRRMLNKSARKIRKGEAVYIGDYNSSIWPMEDDSMADFFFGIALSDIDVGGTGYVKFRGYVENSIFGLNSAPTKAKVGIMANGKIGLNDTNVIGYVMPMDSHMFILKSVG